MNEQANRGGRPSKYPDDEKKQALFDKIFECAKEGRSLTEIAIAIGIGSHIEFPNGGNPIVRAPHAFNTDEGCASISDSNGNLLFYTDGDEIFDSLIGPAVVTGLGGALERVLPSPLNH